MKYFSENTGGFYDPKIHKVWPNDVVAVTDEEHADILEALSATGHVPYVEYGKVKTRKRVISQGDKAKAEKREKKDKAKPLLMEAIALLATGAPLTPAHISAAEDYLQEG